MRRAIFLKVSVIWASTYLNIGRMTVTYTRFEKARIIGARALQLSMGAPSILAEIPKDIIDPVEIAMLEYDEGAIPITVKQKEITT
jgi:DNA-directed RNA polymerase subunit K